MFGRQILSVLQYLGDLRPPVIHRDIKVVIRLHIISYFRFSLFSVFGELQCELFGVLACLGASITICAVASHIAYPVYKTVVDCLQPENIILDEETGNVKIVDFGAVQDVASSTLIGSTVVGTVRFSCSG